jgi:hypothetical protein
MLTSRRISVALGAAMLLCLLLVSSAFAGQPSTVTVRVVGLTGTTLLPQTSVTTNGTPIDPDGNPSDACAGTSAAGALDDAIRGNWVVLYESEALGYQIDGIQGLNFPAFSSDPDAYWSFWMNNAPEEIGACGQELSPGDNIVFFAQCDAKGIDCPTSETEPQYFLTETAPSTAQVGAPVTVTVGALNTTTGKPEPSVPAGITVSAGSVSAVANAEGVATLDFPSIGMYTIEATATDSVPSAPHTVCVHNGNDGTCGTPPPLYACADSAPATSSSTPSCGGPLVAPPPPLPNTALVGGVKANHVYPRHKGPRILSGLVKVPAGGTLRDVRISLQRRTGKRCFAFNGITETFVRDRCGATRFFSVGGSELFSYLLPSSLPKGRYVYDIEAINDAGQATKLAPGVSQVVFYVK